MMDQLVMPGAFCPNEECPDYGKVEAGNVIRYGKSEQGCQRFQCKTCRKTFNDRVGTLFYRRQTPQKDILEALMLLAERVRISSISRAKGFKEDTIVDWLREAAHHAEQVEAILLQDYRMGQSQIDGLWASVGHKGKKQTVNQRIKGNTGAAP